MSQLPNLPRGVSNSEGGSEQPLATARWLAPEKVQDALAFNEQADGAQSPLVIGVAEDGEKGTLLAYDDDRHVVTIAGSRAGKGVSLIIPNLLQYRGSVICIDPKGENASVTAKWRAEALGQQVVVLDPYGVARVPEALRGRYSPLQQLGTADNPEIIDDAAGVADAIVVQGNSKDPHWDESARAFIKGVILFIVAFNKPHERPLGLLRELLTVGLGTDEEPPSIELLCATMRSLTTFEGEIDATPAMLGVIAAAGQTLLDMGDNERGSVLSTARRHTEFLDSPQIVTSSAASDFNPWDIKAGQRGLTVYVVLPEWRIGTHARWLRLVINTFLYALERSTKARPDQPHVLMILEEFAALGHMQSVERAAGYIAGFGVKLWSIIQDLGQLKDIYKARWETFLGNAGLLTAFGNADLTTLEYLSKRLGETEVIRATRSENFQRGTSLSQTSLARRMEAIGERGFSGLLGADNEGMNEGYSLSASEGLHKSPLLNPDEIARIFARETGHMLVLVAGLSPIVMNRIQYFRHEIFKRRCSGNPFV